MFKRGIFELRLKLIFSVLLMGKFGFLECLMDFFSFEVVSFVVFWSFG